MLKTISPALPLRSQPSQPVLPDKWKTFHYTWGQIYVIAKHLLARCTLLNQYLNCKSYKEDFECKVWQKEIVVSRNGVVVEVADETCHVYSAMQCVRRYELNLVEQQSSLFSTIKSTVGIIFPKTKILLPSQNSYHPEITSESPCTKVAHSILGNSKVCYLPGKGNFFTRFSSIYPSVPNSTVKIVCKAIKATQIQASQLFNQLVT